MNCTDITYLTDEVIISGANFISTHDFLASNQSQSRTDTVKAMLATGVNVAIVFWVDGAKAYIPITSNLNVPSSSVVIKAYRAFHAVLNNKPDMEGQVWTKI